MRFNVPPPSWLAVSLSAASWLKLTVAVWLPSLASAQRTVHSPSRWIVCSRPVRSGRIAYTSQSVSQSP